MYIFGRGTDEMSAEQLRKKRQIADAMLARGISAPRNAGEGLSAIGNAIGGVMLSRRVGKEESKRRKAAEELFDRVFKGQGGQTQGAEVKRPPVEVSPIPAPREWGFETSGVEPEALEALGKLFDAYGSDIPVISAHRSAEHNAKVGGAKRSQHVHGKAVDLDVSGLSQEERQNLIQIARKNGFGGVGVYGNSLHFDTGEQRHWGPSHGRESTPDWASSSVLTPTSRPGAAPAPTKEAPQPATQQSPPDNLGDLMALAGNEYLPAAQQKIVEALLAQRFAKPEAMTPYQQAQIDLRRAEHDAKLAGTGGYGGAATNVNVNTGPTGIDYGDPPKDMAWARNPDGSIKLDERGIPVALPIINTKLSNEAEKVEKAAKVKGDRSDTASDVVTNAAKLAREAAGRQDLGPHGTSAVGMLPWTDSAEVLRQVSVLKSQAAGNNLQQMRDASPTGGALGNVTEKELKLLQDLSGALDPNSPTFLRDLDQYEQTLLRTIHGVEEGDRIFAASRGGKDAVATSGDDEDDVSDLLEKYGG